MTKHSLAVRALDVSRLGHAQWFFGNLYEAVVRVPDLMASPSPSPEGAARSPAGPGSPVRYYAAATPATLPALLAAAVAGWPERRARPWLVLAAAGSAAGLGITVYVVRAINLRLFFGERTLDEAERERLLRRWYRLNTVRLGVTALAWLAGGQAKARLT